MLAITPLTAAELAARTLDDLSDLLVDAVHGGASVGFVLPFTAADAAAWWNRLVPAVEAGTLLIWVAHDEHGVCGSVQAALEQFPNGRHRAEVKKLLVHRRARRQGLGRGLLAAAERGAAEAGASLLLLDTETGSPAESLYRTHGWIEVGTIPGHAAGPEGVLKPTTYFYKNLPAAA